MKTFNFFLLFLILASVTLFAQTDDAWFQVSKIAENVWRLDDHKAANIYLVAGTDSALIIDTGVGAADLVAAVRKLTDKPLIVVNTHGHPDHCGANYQFEKAYVHVTDSAAARMFCKPEFRAQVSASMLGGAKPDSADLYTGQIFYTQLLPVNEGRVFNLGGIRLEVMETPGHTPGGICLLDRANKRLFSGDNNNILVWLFLKGCLPLSKYLVTLEKQQARLAEFDVLFPGHGPEIPGDFILDQIACVKSILDGTCESEVYKSFAGDGRICKHGRASVAFSPDNL